MPANAFRRRALRSLRACPARRASGWCRMCQRRVAGLPGRFLLLVLHRYRLPHSGYSINRSSPNCMAQLKFGGERPPERHFVSGPWPGWGHPPGKEVLRRIGGTMACKHTGCSRRAHSRGWCTTHYYRRWRSGQPMDAPVRCHTQNVRPKRRRPFEAEYRLLAELGLRRN